MMKTYTYSIFFALAFCIATAQQEVPGRFQRQAGELTIASAADRARLFCQLVGQDAGNITHYKLRLEKRPGKNADRVWNVYTANSRIMVHSVSGMVTAYVNAKREGDRYRGRGRTGKKFTNSDSVAKAHLRSIATRLGVPTSSTMTGYAMKGDGVGQDSRPMGHFGCVFKNSAGDFVASLACDSQDGVVLEYTRKRER